MLQKKLTYINLIILFFCPLCSLSNIIEEGLSYQIFNPQKKSDIGTSEILIIKVDPNFYDINLFSSEQYNHGNLTVKQWAKEHDLIISLNAGMFQKEDYLSNVGYMKQFNYINNPYINSYQSIAAFNPKDSTKKQFKIFDIEKYNGKVNKDKIRDIISNYNSVIQNLRLIKRSAENRWPQQERKWSEVALGEDENGNILLIFSHSPYTMHDFNNILIDLPINVLCAQHLEGGPEASLYLNYGNIELEYAGSYETSFWDNTNLGFWKIPNIIGISKK